MPENIENGLFGEGTSEEKTDIFEKFERTINEVTKERKRPLLIMFYSDPAGEIHPDDIPTLEEVFEDFLKRKGKVGFRELDLLIQTYGGSANTAYRIIQLVRSYCKRLNVLVATHAYSGGTLIGFGADKIEMGRSATLSPVDVQISSDKADTASLALLSIEKYIEFLEHSVRVAKIQEDKNKAFFITELTKELIHNVGTIDLGELFRLRGLTVLHSKMLLHNYMFKNHSDKEKIVENIISKFNQESPTHMFEMDFELVKDTGIFVQMLDDKIYKLLKDIINMCTELENRGVICHFSKGSTNKRIPFFKIFDVYDGGNDNEKK